MTKSNKNKNGIKRRSFTTIIDPKSKLSKEEKDKDSEIFLKSLVSKHKPIIEDPEFSKINFEIEEPDKELGAEFQNYIETGKIPPFPAVSI